MSFKKTFSFLINVLIIALEIGAFILVIEDQGMRCFRFYTEDSNFLLLIASCLFAFFQIKGNVPKWAEKVYLYCLSTTIMTFFVVLFLLAPIGGSQGYWGNKASVIFGYKRLMFGGTGHYMHFLCPLLGFLNFLFFINEQEITKKDLMMCFGLTILYTFILVPLNIAKVTVGPYPFLEVYKQPVIISILYVLGFWAMNNIFNIGVMFACNKRNKRKFFIQQ